LNADIYILSLTFYYNGRAKVFERELARNKLFAGSRVAEYVLATLDLGASGMALHTGVKVPSTGR
jgi:hypothetical protein